MKKSDKDACTLGIAFAAVGSTLFGGISLITGAILMSPGSAFLLGLGVVLLSLFPCYWIGFQAQKFDEKKKQESVGPVPEKGEASE